MVTELQTPQDSYKRRYIQRREHSPPTQLNDLCVIVFDQKQDGCISHQCKRAKIVRRSGESRESDG